MKIYIVGTGMDGEKTLNREAENAINEAKLLIGAKRILQPFKAYEKELFVSYDPHEIAEKLIDTFMPGPITLVLKKKVKNNFLLKIA